MFCGFIDPYGDTIFNTLQLPVLLAELEAAGEATSNKELAHHLELLTELVRQAIDGEPGTFVRFAGD